MKKGFLVCFIFVSLFSVSFSQTSNPPDIQALISQAVNFYKQGNLNAAIDAAESAVKSADKASPKNYSQLALALGVEAGLRKERFQKRKAGLANSGLAKDELLSAFDQINVDGEKAEAAFRRALSIYSNELRTENAQTAILRGDLAWLLYNFFPRDRKTFASTGSSRARIDEAEAMYAQAIQTNERLLGGENNATLGNYLDFADFYLRYSNLEKAIPLYEKYIENVKKKYGENNPALTPALSSYADILAATDRLQEAKEIASQITKISGKPYDVEKNSLNLLFRSKDALSGTKNNRIAIYDEYTPIRRNTFGTAETNFPSQLLTSLRPKFTAIHVTVTVETDENGKVTRAVADTTDKAVKKEAENTVSKWGFRPFTYNGVPRKMRGFVSYVYWKED